MEIRSLEVVGYKNGHVPNTFVSQPDPTRHLGIVLPGLRHSADMPDLHFAGRLLLERRADLLRVEYAYHRTDFLQRPKPEQDEWISTDVYAACTAALAFRPYDRITLVGKSLGTIAMGHLIADRRFQGAACIWSTPLLTVEWLLSRIEQIHPRSLFIIGTMDTFYKPDILKHLERVTNGQSLVIQGADHGLGIPGDIPGSLMALSQMVQALQEFMDQDVKASNRA